MSSAVAAHVVVPGIGRLACAEHSKP
jgi:hypothetical protein